MSDSKYYFVASIRGKDFIQGIPVYAFTEGDTYARGWTSNSVDNKGGFKTLAARISGSRMISLAIPQIFANGKFPLKEGFTKMTIDAYYSSAREKTYMFGMSITTLLQDLNVYRKQPIENWKGIPEPTGAQRKYLEENVQNWSLPVGITLFVNDGQADVVD